MNVRHLSHCLIRVLSAWQCLSFVSALIPANTLRFWTIANIIGPHYVVATSLRALISGPAWIFADNIAIWIAAESRSAVTSGLRLAAVLGFLWYSPLWGFEISKALHFIAQSRTLGNDEGLSAAQVYQLVPSVVPALLVLALALLSEPIGRAAQYSERMRELRRGS